MLGKPISVTIEEVEEFSNAEEFIEMISSEKKEDVQISESLGLNQPNLDDNVIMNNLIEKNMVRKMCEFCQEFPENYPEHVQSCKLCYEFIGKVISEENSFKCLICTFEIKNKSSAKARNQVYKHIMDIHQDKLETKKIPEMKQKNVIPAKTDISANMSIDAQYFKQTAKGFECLKCPAKRSLKSGKAAMKQHVKEKHLNSNEATNDLTINDSSNKENVMEEGNDSTVLSASDTINGKNSVKKSELDTIQQIKNKPQCCYCKAIPINYAAHVALCKVYFKFVSTINLSTKQGGAPKVGYKCRICTFLVRKKSLSTVYFHIKTKHPGITTNILPTDTIALIPNSGNQDGNQKNNLLMDTRKTIFSKKCEYCKQSSLNFSGLNFEKHVKICKIYSGLFKITKKGSEWSFECMKCPVKCPKRAAMYQHIRGKHLKNGQFLTPKGLNDTKMELNEDNDDVTILSDSNDQILTKNCKNCQESFTGTKKKVQDELYEHIKSKHLNGLNVQIVATPKKSNDLTNLISSSISSSTKKSELNQVIYFYISTKVVVSYSFQIFFL